MQRYDAKMPFVRAHQFRANDKSTWSFEFRGVKYEFLKAPPATDFGCVTGFSLFSNLETRTATDEDSYMYYTERQSKAFTNVNGEKVIPVRGIRQMSIMDGDYIVINDHAMFKLEHWKRRDFEEMFETRSLFSREEVQDDEQSYW